MPTVITHFPYLRLEILPLPPVSVSADINSLFGEQTTEATTNIAAVCISEPIQHKWNPGPYWAVCNLYATYPVLLTAFYSSVYHSWKGKKYSLVRLRRWRSNVDTTLPSSCVDHLLLSSLSVSTADTYSAFRLIAKYKLCR
jgi:hypothetical protein